MIIQNNYNGNGIIKNNLCAPSSCTVLLSYTALFAHGFLLSFWDNNLMKCYLFLMKIAIFISHEMLFISHEMLFVISPLPQWEWKRHLEPSSMPEISNSISGTSRRAARALSARSCSLLASVRSTTSRFQVGKKLISLVYTNYVSYILVLVLYSVDWFRYMVFYWRIV